MRLWDLESGAVLREFVHSDCVVRLAFAPDGRRVYSTCLGGVDSAVRIWDATTGGLIGKMDGHKGDVWGLAVSRDGKRVLTGGDTVILWDAETRTEIRRLNGHKGGVGDVALLPDGRRAVSGGWEDGTIRLWDLETGLELHCFRGHGPGGTCVTVSPDGRRLLSSTWSGDVRLWDIEARKQIDQVDWLSCDPICGAFTPDGRHALWTGHDGVIRVYNVFDQLQRSPSTTDSKPGPPTRAEPAPPTRAELLAVLNLKETAGLAEIARHFAMHVEPDERSDQAALLLERLFEFVPSRHGTWDNAEEPLAAQVAQRDAVFNRVIKTRPNDSLLWAERGRYLAWMRKWDEALAAYDRMIHDHGNGEDAFVEYASLLLLQGKKASYSKCCDTVVGRFGKTGGRFDGTMLARICGFTADALVDKAKLVRWAEQAIAYAPKAPTELHCLGLALLRAGRFEEAVKALQASLARESIAPGTGTRSRLFAATWAAAPRPGGGTRRPSSGCRSRSWRLPTGRPIHRHPSTSLTGSNR